MHFAPSVHGGTRMGSKLGIPRTSVKLILSNWNSSMRCFSRHTKAPSKNSDATGPKYTPLRISPSLALNDCTALMGKYEPVPGLPT